ncbi:flagellar basal body rod protein FlgB [Lachnoclostridium phytofermentans]|uniref:Flagellar basal body rod protein FlgB n=1 Tax=Lachnoclostridium phytofermentans (strain ATCC 700394 / DSM 18823 / ISDg) TaxID=357809 RepID=A9KNG4_LACP7|nr:flagellar basal body rod protein FlgB [Lachnoclostridium phytofermentans]ABX43081.1 flagellar basal-body rod protein FlgB [Lachnoclostridium phytofermentans ISDg]
MIGSNAFGYINMLNKAADASVIRQELLSNNLANNDTPNYKRKDLNFESYLKKELKGDEDLDKRVAKANLSKLDGSIYTDRANLSYRYDGNNVDVDVEEGYVAENQIRYYTLLQTMTEEFQRLRMVLSR